MEKIIIGLAPALLQIAMGRDLDVPIRQDGVTYLKRIFPTELFPLSLPPKDGFNVWVEIVVWDRNNPEFEASDEDNPDKPEQKECGGRKPTKWAMRMIRLYAFAHPIKSLYRTNVGRTSAFSHNCMCHISVKLQRRLRAAGKDDLTNVLQKIVCRLVNDEAEMSPPFIRMPSRIYCS